MDVVRAKTGGKLHVEVPRGLFFARNLEYCTSIFAARAGKKETPNLNVPVDLETLKIGADSFWGEALPRNRSKCAGLLSGHS